MPRSVTPPAASSPRCTGAAPDHRCRRGTCPTGCYAAGRATACADIRLQTGDVVFVPVHGTRVQVTGAVTRPAIYDLKPGETLPDLVGAAGGFRADAALKRVSVYRILPAAERGSSPSGRVVMDVPLATEKRDGASK